jgi:hypothetical protein
MLDPWWNPAVEAQAIDRAGQMHQRHYGMLLKHLQNNNTAEMQKIQQLQQ